MYLYLVYILVYEYDIIFVIIFSIHTCIGHEYIQLYE